LFEGIPCPVNSSALLNFIPLSGSAQIFNFPASAWWGTGTAAGAVQLIAPNPTERSSGRISSWGASGDAFGIGGRVQNQFFGMDFNYRHGTANGLGDINEFNIISKERWLQNKDIRIDSGFLGTHGVSDDSWYSGFASITLYSPNFQSLEFKPYYQSVRFGAETIQEEGGFLNYLFNLAGLAKSHLGVGLNHDDVQTSFGTSRYNNGFVRSTNLIDLLGNATVDLSFRFDFSSIEKTAFSTMLGFQNVFGDLTLVCDYDKSVQAVTFQDVQQIELGFRYQPDDEWVTTLKYLHEQVSGNSYDGGRFLFQLKRSERTLFFARVGVNLESQLLKDAIGSLLLDSSVAIQMSFFEPDILWAKARVLSNEALYWEAGETLMLNKNLSIYLSAANLGNINIAMPDADLLAGRTVSGGLQGSF
jgi:hypothetical protein